MKKLNFFLLLSAIMMTTMSFRTENFISGTYGVSANDPSHISLTLQEDHSFSYLDMSNPGNKINVAGQWEMANNKIILKSTDATSFHNVWRISADGKVAKSKKGMTFYTLIRH